MASIIVVALKGMFKQILDLRRFGHESPVDGFIWICTFLGTVFLDIDIGLAIGACLSLLFLFLWGCLPNMRVLNATEAEDLLVDAQMYQAKSVRLNFRLIGLDIFCLHVFTYFNHSRIRA